MNDTSHSVRRMLRTEHAAKLTGISASTLTKLRLTGAGPDYLKIGKIVVYDPADLETWLASKRRRSTTVVV